MSGWLRGIVFAAAIAAPTAIVLAQTDPAPSADSITGRLLVSSPNMADPRFERTVVLVVHHDKDGAFGLVINRPVEEHPIAEVLEWLGQSGAGVEGKVRLFAGGPVQTSIGIVVHSTEYRSADSVIVGGGVSVTSSPQILRDIGQGKGPKHAFMTFGYAGWGAGQLDTELSHHDWESITNDAQLVFAEEAEKIWSAAWARRAIEL